MINISDDFLGCDKTKKCSKPPPAADKKANDTEEVKLFTNYL